MLSALEQKSHVSGRNVYISSGKLNSADEVIATLKKHEICGALAIGGN
jgi:hypothetical protein